MIKKIKFLKSKNIYLRPFLKKDLSLSYLKWINNRDINMFLETTRFPSSDKDLELFYKKNLNSKNCFFVLLAIRFFLNFKDKISDINFETILKG